MECDRTAKKILILNMSTGKLKEALSSCDFVPNMLTGFVHLLGRCCVDTTEISSITLPASHYQKVLSCIAKMY